MQRSARGESEGAADPTTSASDAEFENFFRRNYVHLVTLLTPLSSDAADAAQEAFIQAHRQWREIGRYDNPAAWVRRVAMNRLRDEHRRGLTRQRLIARLRAVEAISREPDSEVDIQSALSLLPTRQRLAVTLFYLGELSIAEVADSMQISEGAVKSALHRARGTLRAILEEQNE